LIFLRKGQTVPSLLLSRLADIASRIGLGSAAVARLWVRPLVRWNAAWAIRAPLKTALVWVTLASLASMMLIDRPLALVLKAQVAGDWQGFWRVVTDLGLGGHWYLGAAVVWGWSHWRMRRTTWPESWRQWATRARAMEFLILTQAASGAVVTVLKWAVGRLRPVWLFREDMYGFAPLSFDWAANSFPSGHSQTIWAAMTALMVLFPRHWPTWIALAALVAASRLFLTVHYLSDVLMGSYLGIATVVLMARWYRRRGVCLRLGRSASSGA